MLKRLLYTNLLAWKNRPSRLPLILRGARQVGKTTLLTDFGKKEFQNFISLNLEQKEYQAFFTGSFENAISTIEYSSKTRIEPKNTLVFLDEIQACPDAVNMLRFFAEKMPDLHVACAGSLLEIKLLRKQISFPTGRVEYLFMAPMTFAEYLGAKKNDIGLDKINNAPDKISEGIHNMLLKELYEYYRIGGLPRIVNARLDTGSEGDVIRMHTDLFQSILDDVDKYVSKSEAKYIELVFGAAPYHLAERITYARFHASEFLSREMKEAFDILEKAFLVFRSLPTSVTTPPVMKKFNVAPKLFFFDIGLANSRLNRAYRPGIDDASPRNKGSFAEQFVCQELLALHNQIPETPCFWMREKKNSNAEVDFCVEWNNNLVPVEIKSGKSGKMKSLGVFLQEAPHKIAVKISTDPFSIVPEAKTGTDSTFRLINIPLYMTHRIIEILNQFGQADSGRL